MKIGLTYDLRTAYLAAGYSEEETAEFDRAETIDAIAAALEALGHEVERVGNARELVPRLAAGQRWDLVFNICEGLHGLAREAQVPALLDLYEIPYTFSDPLVTALSLHKGMTKTLVREAGVPTPAFRLVSQRGDLDDFALRFPVFAKPVAEGTGKGITAKSKITAQEELWPRCDALLRQFRQPVLVEEFLPGREFTTGILGTGEAARVLGTMEILLRAQAEPEVYSYTNKENCEELVDYGWPTAADDPEVARVEEIALLAWRALGCRDGGRIDLRSDAQGQPQFLEVNPLAGLHPQHSDLPMIAEAKGYSFRELIQQIVNSAAKRVLGRRESPAL